MWANICGKWNEGGRQSHRCQLGDYFLVYRTFLLGNDRCPRLSSEWCLAAYIRNCSSYLKKVHGWQQR